MKIIRSDDEKISILSAKELGGKGYHLVQLTNNGFNLPPFIVLTSQFLADITASVDLSSPDAQSEAFRPAYINKVREAIDVYKFSEVDELLILDHFDEYLGEDGYISVRSSGGDEDGENASFAGQYASFLYVKRDDILDKIKSCFASAWSEGVISYRINQGIDLQKMDFAVVLQKMIFAESAGVGFSMNPSGNLADAVIVAGYGVGEGIVADKVASDMYLINRQDERISKMIKEKPHKLHYTEEQGLVESKVDVEKVTHPVLSDENIKRVYASIMKVEKLLESVVDIEFCFDENDELFLLQARPVTSIDLSKIKLLDNTNIAESYPGISLPLTFSFARHAYEKAFQGASKAFWISKEALKSTDGIFKDLLGYHQGRVYYRLDNWYKMITLVFSSKKSIESWEKAVGLKRPPSDEIKLSFGNKLKVYASTIWRILRYKRGNRRFFQLFDTHYRKLRQTDLTRLSLAELSDTLDSSAKAFFDFWYLTLINDLMTFKSFDWVQKGIQRRELGSEDLANDLIAGIHQSESELSIVEVLKLKDEILGSSELTLLFEQDAYIIWEAVSAKDYDGFSERVRQHIDRFGDRILAELKLENPSFRRESWRFMDLLKGQLKTPGSLKEYQQKQSEKRQTSNDLLDGTKHWWSPKSYFFQYAIRTAAYGTRNREDMRFCRTRIYGAVKDVYLEIGKRLEGKGSIKSVEDVFYLTTDEVRLVCQGNEALALKELVKVRKSEVDRNRFAELPDRIIYTDLPPVFHAHTLDRHQNEEEMVGIPVSQGVVRAEAIVVSEPDYDLDVFGKIIITEITDPGWVFLMSQASGLVSQKGSLLSHAAIVGREMGIPVVVNVEDVTKRIVSGDTIEMDGQRGTVRIVKKKQGD